jgi:cytochrome c oxidase subunit 2
MWEDLPLWPEQASTVAGEVDALYIFLVGASAVMSLLIVSLLAFFAIRYRRKSKADRSGAVHESLRLELGWTLIPLGIVMIIFVWSSAVFFHISRAPDDTLDVLVIGKRWMWKLQHQNGKREINELHVPVDRDVKLTMTSEDVIHSFYVPAFRVKADAVPGRYTSIWFRATKPGRYHLFCAEYCGTKHSQMIGQVIVMERDEFQHWLGGELAGLTPAAQGERLFANLGCNTCHKPEAIGRGPTLVGIFGTSVELEGGGRVVVDESYVRESIVDPRARLVSGYKALMPTYRGLIGEQGLMNLIEYIKSIGPDEAGEGAASGAPAGDNSSGAAHDAAPGAADLAPVRPSTESSEPS